MSLGLSLGEALALALLDLVNEATAFDAVRENVVILSGNVMVVERLLVNFALIYRLVCVAVIVGVVVVVVVAGDDVAGAAVVAGAAGVVAFVAGAVAVVADAAGVAAVVAGVVVVVVASAAVVVASVDVVAGAVVVVEDGDYTAAVVAGGDAAWYDRQGKDYPNQSLES